MCYPHISDTLNSLHKQNFFASCIDLLLRYLMQYEEVYPFDPQEDIVIEDELMSSINIPEFEEYGKPTIGLEQATKFHVNNKELQRNASMKRLQDMLNDYQSDTPTSVDSCSDFYDIESEVSSKGLYYLN